MDGMSIFAVQVLKSFVGEARVKECFAQLETLPATVKSILESFDALRNELKAERELNALRHAEIMQTVTGKPYAKPSAEIIELPKTN